MKLVKSLAFFPKRFSSYHEYYKADITTGNINDINVTYILWYLIKQDKLIFYEESCFVTFFTTFTQLLDRTALLFALFLWIENIPLFAAACTIESHAHHMPTNYHLNGGGLCKYTEREWLLYALGSVKPTPHVVMVRRRCKVWLLHRWGGNFHLCFYSEWHKKDKNSMSY